MEQKQLDEIDESYFGEEFIEDEFVAVEDLASQKNTKAESKPKTTKKKSATKKTAKKEAKTDTVKDAKKETKKEEPAKAESPKEEKVEEPVVTVVDEKPKKETPSTVETAKPVDPWATEDDEPSLFSEAATWKALTGIAVILLVLSLFTNGFSFGTVEASSLDGLSFEEAELKVVQYVNNNLVQEPFLASSEGIEDVNGVYKVKLALAGETIDTYITKDGTMFFPQGFDTSVAINTDAPVVEQPHDEVSLDEPTEPVVEEPVVEEPTEEPTPAVTAPSGEVHEVSMTYKKWTFSPKEVTVPKGSRVKLTLTPDTSNPDFTLSGFTLVIPQANLEKLVTGTTTIEFDATAESYDLECGSCSGTQAMVLKAAVQTE